MGKKFKLIKLYPSSPALGTEVNYSETHQIYNNNGGNYYTELPKHQVENLLEFWQEIKEVNLEVPIGTKFVNRIGELFTIKKVEDDCALIQWNTPNYMISRIQIEQVNKYFKDGTWVIYKEKLPIFLDELGNEVFEGDIFYFVNHMFWDLEKGKALYGDLRPGIKHFKNKIEALEYIDENKPIFSKKQVEEALNWGKHEYYNSMNSTKWYRVFKEKLGL